MLRNIIVLIAALLSMPSALAATQHVSACPSNGSQIQQLRIYELNRGNQNDFHKRFQDHALRIMLRHGFNVLDIWESDSGTKVEFVYLLAWPSEAVMDARWKDFLQDEEWIAIKKRTAAESGDLVNAVSGRTLSRMVYSPACTGQ